MNVGAANYSFKVFFKRSLDKLVESRFQESFQPKISQKTLI